MTVIDYVFLKLQTAKDVVREVSKNPISEDLSTSYMVNCRKY